MSFCKRTCPKFGRLVTWLITLIKFFTSAAVWIIGTMPWSRGRWLHANMTGAREPFVHVPYFFSDVFDLSYEFWGDTADADQVVFCGDVNSSSFSAWWLKAG